MRRFHISLSYSLDIEQNVLQFTDIGALYQMTTIEKCVQIWATTTMRCSAGKNLDKPTLRCSSGDVWAQWMVSAASFDLTLVEAQAIGLPWGPQGTCRTSAGFYYWRRSWGGRRWRLWREDVIISKIRAPSGWYRVQTSTSTPIESELRCSSFRRLVALLDWSGRQIALMLER